MPKRRPGPSTPDLAALLPSWELHLRAERKSPQTVKVYGDGVGAFLRWCAAEDRPAVLDRPTVAGFVAALLDAGAEAATARSRQLALRRFWAWLLAEGEADSDELVSVKPPKLDTKVTPVLTDAEVRALIKACAGSDMWHRRDEAIVRLMVETGARAGEVVALTVADVEGDRPGRAVAFPRLSRGRQRVRAVPGRARPAGAHPRPGRRGVRRAILLRRGAPVRLLSSEQPITAEQADTYGAIWHGRHKGKRKTAVLGNGLQYQETQSTPESSQFLDTQKWVVQQICRIYGVPPEIVASEAGGSLTYANVEQGRWTSSPTASAPGSAGWSGRSTR